jgi:hypothetical protein
VNANGVMTLEFAPASKELRPESAPILSAIEIYDEGFRVAAR